jgi:alkylation response protein AidB-like acyl-CoA dehydrogenase
MDMNLDFTEEQEMLREMVRGVCAEYASLESVRAMEDDPTGFTSDFWKQLGELGLLGLIIPEAYDGSGMTLLDAAVVYEEFGRSLAPSPHFVSSILGAQVLLGAGSEDQKKELLPKIASGAAILTPAWLEPDNGYGPKGIQMRAEAQGDDLVLNGVKRHVLFASAATHLIVPVRIGDGLTDVDLLLVDPSSAGISMTQQMSLASDTQYRVEFDGVKVPAANRIGAAGSGWATWNAAMLDGIALLAVQAMGGAAQALEMTCEFSKDRHQFGKPLAAFQAISHYLADASTEISGGTTLAYEAAWASANGEDTKRLAPMAKLFCCQAYRDMTAMCEQVYGGVGFTVEYDIQLFFRRAKQLQITWWDSAYLEELIAVEVLDS